jgi:hypothetical protein
MCSVPSKVYKQQTSLDFPTNQNTSTLNASLDFPTKKFSAVRTGDNLHASLDLGPGLEGVRVRAQRLHHVVALQVEFERRTLKPIFSLDRFRLWV